MGGKRNKRHFDKDHRRKGESTASRVQSTPVKPEEVIAFAPLFPGRVGSDLSFVEFVDEVEPSLLMNMAKFSTLATRIIFPLIVAIGFRSNPKEGLYPIIYDAAALHITAFAVESFMHQVLHRRKSLSPVAIMHFQKGLRLLQERILGDDEEKKVSDSTIGVVLKLASAANFEGDFRAAQHHMEGVRKMVDPRGGFDSFKDSNFQSEMLRCDLSIALLSGSHPVIFRQPSELAILYPETLLYPSKEVTHSPVNFPERRHVDERLVAAWDVMKNFCLLVNLGTQTQRLIDPAIIHETMASVMYRLLHMTFDAGSLEEVVRLGLLAFSHHIFLQWQDIKPPHSHFSTAYRRCISGLDKLEMVSDQFMLWVLMTGAISFFDPVDAGWLRDLLKEYSRRCQVKGWKDMQEILKSFLWVALLDERPAKQVYESLHLGHKGVGIKRTEDLLLP